jgi:hypothetical protein
MRARIIFLLLQCIILVTPLTAEELEDATPIKHLFSLDLGYSLTGFKNSGWGIGVNYEHKLLNFLSLKGGIGHMTFKTDIADLYCTSVNVSFYVHYYPLATGLDKSYIGVGGCGDFMNYFGGDAPPLNPEDTLISIIPITGWKWNVLKHLMIDVHVGYKFIIQDGAHYAKIKDYVNTGVQFGIGFNILFGSSLVKT